MYNILTDKSAYYSLLAFELSAIGNLTRFNKRSQGASIKNFLDGTKFCLQGGVFMTGEELLEVYGSSLDILFDSFISFFKIVIDNIPAFFPTIGIFVALKLFEHFTKPKYDGLVFDDNYAKDFDLAYDSLRGMYDSDDDFINDYMSDFTSFQDDEPELDELVEYDMWDRISSDRYYDDETAFSEESETEFSIYFEDFEGSYSDYLESESD